ncbi:hypothetical protein N657DRAFT_208844 [Parathielavia appendiculata]|uniref:Uncharacterized protein n=1 Tax=Parathielavia appendiculata TaxID=2587402 RepID=A0AAN6U6M1_9PEZI|nr:hypothetical protein N657DRAFT_208844 [Parathielavia appendiculata]
MSKMSRFSDPSKATPTKCMQCVGLRKEKTIVTSSTDATIRVRDAETATRVYTLSTSSGAKSVAISYEHSVLVGGCADGQVRLWDLMTGNQFPYQTGKDGHSGGIFAVDIPHNTKPKSDRSTQVITASVDKTIKLWTSSANFLVCIRAWTSHRVLRSIAQSLTVRPKCGVS